MADHRRLGRNDPCHCGSRKKYKYCHLNQDEEEARTQRAEVAENEHEEWVEERLKRGFPADHEHYHPLTRKIPAVERQDFRALVARLSQTGASLLIGAPLDVGRTQEALDEALRFCRERGVPVEFPADPPLGMVTGLQVLVDSMFGRGVYQVRQSGTRLHDYGHSRAANEAGNTVFYLGTPDEEAIRLVLIGSAGNEARAQGIEWSPLSGIMSEAQVLRHLTVHYLELPDWAQGNIRRLLGVEIDAITDMAVDLDLVREPEGRSAAAALATLPFALALPMAIDNPAATLQGMGLSEEDAAELVPHLEQVRDHLPGIRRAADCAGEDWDTFDGFSAWHDRLAEIPEIADFVGLSDRYTERQHDERGEGEEGVETVGAAVPTEATAASPAEANHGAPPTATTPPSPATDLPPVATNPDLFHPLGQVRELYADRREEIKGRRGDAERERDDALQAKAEAEARVADVNRTIGGLTARLGDLDTDFSRLGVEERAARVRMAATILSHGARQLDEAAASWAGLQVEPMDLTYYEHERTVAEYETMTRSGLLEKLPEFTRLRLEEDASRSREALRERYGHPFSLVLPVAILGDADAAVPTVTIALPLHDDLAALAPESVGVTIATAVCEGIREALGSIPVTQIQSIEGGHCTLLHYQLRDLGAQTRVDLLDLLALGVEDAAERSVPLRRTRMGIQCITLPELDEDALADALTQMPVETAG